MRWNEKDWTDSGLSAVLEFLRARGRVAGDVQAVHRGAHSNDVLELRLEQDRSLIVKRGRHEWARERFAKSRDAAAAIRSSADIVVPEPFSLPRHDDSPPLQAYWRIPLPTLDRLWPQLGTRARHAAMRSWGRLIQRLHGVRLSSWGDSWRHQGENQPLLAFLESDIGHRLLPACRDLWPAAVPAVERLLGHTQSAVDGSAHQPVLVHNDMHMGNVLCEYDGAGVRCVGLLDLEAAVAAPPESDLASLEVLHGPLFEQHVAEHWVAQVESSYGKSMDDRSMIYFRALHLLNLGFYSALVGLHHHAGRVLEALEAEVAALDRGSQGPATRH